MSKNETRCSKCGYVIYSSGVRECPHPAVQQRLGKNICHWCCDKCKYNKKEKIGQTCNYGKE